MCFFLRKNGWFVSLYVLDVVLKETCGCFLILYVILRETGVDFSGFKEQNNIEVGEWIRRLEYV